MAVLKPIIPGTVIGFTGEIAPRVPPSAAETVAVPLIHDWGPLGSEEGPVLVTSFAEFIAKFGDSDTPGRTAVAGAFAGHGIPTAGGAGGVLVYRMATGSAARAAKTIQNTTPANAITLTARYAGVRGNDLSVAIDDDPSDNTRDRLRIRYKGAVQETYLYTATDIAGLVATINARSQLVTAASLITGVALTATAGVSFTAGNSGTALTSTQWLSALSALEFGAFSILAPYDLTDGAIQASLLSWIRAQAAANRPVRVVIGGAAAEVIDTAVSRSADLADEHVVNFGVGTWHDDLLDKNLSTSQLAPRIAGILASRGEEHGLTFARIGGLRAVGATGPAIDAIEQAVQEGVTVLMRASAPDAEVRIARGVTTFIDDSDPDRPVEIFSDPRLVGIMDNYVRRMKEWGDNNIIGNVTVTNDSRNAVRGEGRRLQDDLLRRGLILSKAQGAIADPFVTADDPGDPALADAIPYDFGWQFARTANYILGNGRIR